MRAILWLEFIQLRFALRHECVQDFTLLLLRHLLEAKDQGLELLSCLISVALISVLEADALDMHEAIDGPPRFATAVLLRNPDADLPLSDLLPAALLAGGVT